MTTPTAEESRTLLKRYAIAQLALGDGCSDGNCVVKRPKGVHTNGGCKCLYQPDHYTAQRAGHVLTIAQEMDTHLRAALEREAEALAEVARLREALETVLDVLGALSAPHELCGYAISMDEAEHIVSLAQKEPGQ